jgi:hypothetical protein
MNFWSLVACTSLTEDEPVEVLARCFEFWLRQHRGRLAAGRGNHSIGDLLPGCFAQLGLREIAVHQADRPAALFPPYKIFWLCLGGFASLRNISRVQRLGKNHGGYHGERIDIHAVLRDLESAALKHGWTAEIFFTHGEFKWLALRRPSRITHHASRIYISAGIHGDEPAGPLAALKLIQENPLAGECGDFLLPCLNPAGFTLNRRENADGIDLNRDYRNPKSAEVRAHIAWLERQPRFDLYLCLHEDWESRGFYLYEQNPDNSRRWRKNHRRSP